MHSKSQNNKKFRNMFFFSAGVWPNWTCSLYGARRHTRTRQSGRCVEQVGQWPAWARRNGQLRKDNSRRSELWYKEFFFLSFWNFWNGKNCECYSIFEMFSFIKKVILLYFLNDKCLFDQWIINVSFNHVLVVFMIKYVLSSTCFHGYFNFTYTFLR